MRPVFAVRAHLEAPVQDAVGDLQVPNAVVLLDAGLPDAPSRLDDHLSASEGVLVLVLSIDDAADWLDRLATEVVVWPCPAAVLRARVARCSRLQRLPFLERLFDLADDAVEMTRRDATLLDVNPAFIRNTGYSREEAVGNTPAELFRSQFHDPLFYEQIPAAHKLGEAWKGGLTARRKDGTFAQQEVWIAEVPDPNGRIVGHLSVKRDMERDDLARRAQATAQSRMRSLLDQMFEGVIVHDLTGKVLEANPSALRMLELDEGALRGSSMLELEDGAHLQKSWQALEPGHPERAESTWRRSDGSTFPVEVSRDRTTMDGAHVVLTVARDITEQVVARRKMEDLNARLHGLTGDLEDLVHERTVELRRVLAERGATLESLVDGLAAVDRDGLIQVANPELMRLLDIDQTSSAGAMLADLDPRLGELAKAAIDRERVQVEEIALSKNRTALVTASPILVQDEEIRCRGSVVLVRDVTLQREVDRMKTDFIATVSHELRTPLTSVLGFAKLVRDKFRTKVLPVIPASEAQALKASIQIQRNLDIIASEGQRLASLINDVLDISKMEAGRVEWRSESVLVLDLVSRALEVVSGLFVGEEVVLTQDVPADLPSVRGDPERLLQVLINLLSNAQKFTDHGEVRVRVRKVGDAVEFTVSDTGTGIAVDDHAKVFEKFRQAGDTLTSKPRGTGLGLPICKQIVDHHGGRLWVESKLGAGSRFSFTIPVEGDVSLTPRTLLAHQVLERVNELSAVMGPAHGSEILVVDDSDELRSLLRQILEEHGYIVRDARNGLEALQSVRQRAPDLVVLDVMMPDITGFDVAASLRADPITMDLPIVILSIVADQIRGRQLGVDRYLTKPLDDGLLLQTIQDLLNRGHQRRRVLLVASNSDVAGTMVDALRARGETVRSASSPEDALRLAREAAPDVVMVVPPAGDGGQWIRMLRADPVLESSWVLLVGEGA